MSKKTPVDFPVADLLSALLLVERAYKRVGQNPTHKVDLTRLMEYSGTCHSQSRSMRLTLVQYRLLDAIGGTANLRISD